MKRGKNNKGFTLVEILAAVTIMGILAAIAIPAVYRYVTKSRDLSYDSMYNSVYDAVKNYRINTSDDTFKGRNGPTYSRDEINKLIEWKYLEPLIDPADREKQCTSEVYIYNCIDSSELDTLNGYLYTVMLKCSAHSGSKTFDDTGELLSSSEQNECLGISDFVVDEKTIKMKYADQNGADYYGDWTNQNVWIGNFSIKSGNEIKEYQYTFDINNPLTEKVESFGSDAIRDGYTFTTDINKKFRIRAVDVNGNVGAWSEKIYEVRIDKTPPDVTMAIINSNNNFEKKFTGTATDNSYTHATWVGKSDNAIPNVKISAKDNKSGAGVDSNLTVNYNISGASTFPDEKDENNKKWNGASGNKSFNKSNTFTANGLDDGYRVVNCTVKDKAGNETTGTIKVMIDATPPKFNFNLIGNDNKSLYNKVIKESQAITYEKDGNKWFNSTAHDSINVSDNLSGIYNNELIAYYNTAGITSSKNKNYDKNLTKYTRNLVNGNASSDTLLDGLRYMEYTASDNAGNKTVFTFEIKIDTVPPVLDVAFYCEDGKVFSIDSNSKAVRDGGVFEYGYWINKKKALTKEVVTVEDGMSGPAKKNTRTYYTSYANYKLENKKESPFNLTNGSYTYSGSWKNGYRTVKYTVKDKAGNPTNLTVKFKVDQIPPTGSVKILKGTQTKYTITDSKQITTKIDYSVNLKITGDDTYTNDKKETVVGSGVSSFFDIALNKPGQTKCDLNSTLQKPGEYAFSSVTRDDGVPKSRTRIINGALKNGCRTFKVTISDNAGNERDIVVSLNKTANSNPDYVESNSNPDGCNYVEYPIRNTGFTWKCSAGHYHTKAHFIVCKETDSNGKITYYAKKNYYKKQGWSSSASPTLICPCVTNYEPGRKVDKTWKILQKDTRAIFKDYYDTVPTTSDTCKDAYNK